MIGIKKGRELDKLLRYRQQDGASYEQMDKAVKEELLQKLLQEQGHICAYCMKRIPERRALPAGVSPVTVEHWYPRNPERKEDIGQGLDYRNMLAVCSGNRGCGNRERMTCDAHRGNARLKVNPCRIETLRGITYKSSGRIQHRYFAAGEQEAGTAGVDRGCEKKAWSRRYFTVLQEEMGADTKDG